MTEINENPYPRLVVLSGSQKGTIFGIQENTYVGRDESCQIRIADTSLSRRHFLLRKHKGEITIQDLKSLNGTMVDGKNVTRRRLEHGCEIMAGNTAFWFLVKDAEKEAAFEGWMMKSTTRLSANPPNLDYQITKIRETIVGKSRVMMDLFDTIAQVAYAESTVLIYGESGTGKELVAREIHRQSARSSEQFVAINCAAIPETLLESELFGFEKGSFSGAIHSKQGKIEVANGGTLFLDEVGDLGRPLQAKLLRVIQERELEKLGATHPTKINIRLVAATNRDLIKMIKKGEFREDLFYRLNVVPVSIPPLRIRKDDIPLLVQHFLNKMSRATNKPQKDISPDALAILMKHDWPGNVRELENLLERTTVLAKAAIICLDDLRPLISFQNGLPNLPTTYQDTVWVARKDAILEALRKSGGNYSQAAKLLGMQRTYLHKIVRKLKIR